MIETETRLIPLTLWNKYHPWPPIGGWRYQIKHAEENGLKEFQVIRRMGRKIFIDEARFFEWFEACAE